MKILRAQNLNSISALHHGFFTRHGGVSSGLYATLNCGIGSADDAEKIAQNRELVRRKLEASALCTLKQIHSAQVIRVVEPWAAADAPEGDALVTDKAGIALGVLTADCAPLLFADSGAGIIAAVHAGWRGAFAGVAEATITAMENLGAMRENIAAAIGPTIAQSSYEVGEDFVECFITADPDNSRFFTPAGSASGKYCFNLQAYVGWRLKNAGITDINMLEHDTYTMEADFFSYRRAGRRGEADYGRQISCIVMSMRG